MPATPPYPPNPPTPSWAAQHTTPYRAPQQPPKSARGKQVLMYGCVAMVSLGLGSGLGGGGKTDASSASAAPTPSVTVTATATVTAIAAAPAPTVTVTKTATVTAKPKAAKAAKVAATVPGDGTYLVGSDMKSGTYKTKGPADGSFGCYWARAKDSSGELNSIIANDNLNGSGVVTVRKGETFKSSGCQDWVKAG
jgi:hypothetical protein